MSCLRFHQLLEDLVATRNCYASSIDDTFFHFYDLAVESTDINDIVDKVILLLELLQRSPVPYRANDVRLRRQYIPKLANDILDLYRYRFEILRSDFPAKCQSADSTLYGEPRYQSKFWKGLSPLATGVYRGALSGAYDKLLDAVNELFFQMN
jgi:hypothetical protein